MLKEFCVGIVVRNRIELTESTLMSMYYSDQPKSSYDVIIINNGSDEKTSKSLNNYVKSGFLPVKNLIHIPEISVSKAWNLFLSMSKDYNYRIKYDNDLILQNTINPTNREFSKVGRTETSSPADADPLAGAPRSVGIIKGHIHRPKKQKDAAIKVHSCFLDHMKEFATQNNVSLTSLVPISPNETFTRMYHAVLTARRNKMPYLFGACMMVDKKSFDLLGYFDERLPRRIDIEYSQRAIRNKLNIGYHPFYGVVHIGTGNSTESKAEIQEKYNQANEIERTVAPIDQFCSSKWSDKSDKIIEKASKYKILNLK